MAASPEKIREVIEQYVARVATGTTDEILDALRRGRDRRGPGRHRGAHHARVDPRVLLRPRGAGAGRRGAERADRGRRRRPSCSSCAPRPATDLHAGADRRDDLRRRRQDHLDAGLLGRGRHVGGLRRRHRPPDRPGGQPAEHPHHGPLRDRQPGQPQRQPGPASASARPRPPRARRTAGRAASGSGGLSST